MSDLFSQSSGTENHPQMPPPKRARKPKPAIQPATAREQYTATKHCCRICFGRVLKSAAHQDPPIYRCADCGASGAGAPSSICACGMAFNTGRSMGIRCIENPERSAISPMVIVACEGKP